MFRAVPGEVSYFSTLKTCIWGIPSSGSVPLEVVLGSVALVLVRVPLSAKVIILVVSSTMVVPLSAVWCSIPVNVHGDQGVVHPSWGIWQIVLGRVSPVGWLWVILSLQAWIVPLWPLLLRSKSTEVFIPSSKDIFKEYFQSHTSKGFLGLFLVRDGCWVAHHILGYVLWQPR